MPSVTWGNQIGSGSNARFVLSYDRIDYDSTNGWLVNPKVEMLSNSGWSDSVNSISVGGSAIADGQIHSGTLTSGGTRTWWPGNEVVPLNYGSGQWRTFTLTVSNLSYFAGDSTTKTYTWDIWFPERPYQLPNEPVGFSGSRVNDNRVDLSWAGDYTGSNGARPWSGLRLDRWDNVSGTWTRIANLGWDATSYSDHGTVPNREYKYALWAYNPAGDSAHVHVDPIYTTPAAPTIGTPTKAADGSILVYFTNRSPYASAIEVQDSPDGTTWTTLTSSGQPSAAYYTHASPNQSVTHRYRVRAKAPSGLWSAWSATSSVVQLQAPPNAPTSLGPSVAASGEAHTLTWTHNPVDSTPQTAYEVESRLVGGVFASSGKVTSTAASRMLAAGTFTANYEFRVRTWGAHADPSPWSATQQVVVAARPVVGITSPLQAAVLPSPQLTVSITYSQPAGQPLASWNVTLVQAGQPLESRTGGPADPLTNITFATPLANNTTYQVVARVTSSAGLASTDQTHTVSVVYAPPPTPDITIVWDPVAAAAIITVTNPAGTPTVVANRIYGNGKFIGETGPNGSLSWRTVPLSGATMYAQAVSDTPTTADSIAKPVPIPQHADVGIHLNAGPGYGYHAAFWDGSPSVGWTPEVDVDLTTFAGDSLPSATFGNGRPFQVTVSGRVRYDDPDSSREHWLRVLQAKTTFCYRDAVRTVYGVVTDPSFTETYVGRGDFQFTFVQTLNDDADLFDYEPTIIEDPPGSGQYRIIAVANDTSIYGILP